MKLVAGATGFLGAEICLLLRSRGEDVRALVRPASDPARRKLLRDAGVQLVDGDLTDPASLRAACAGVTTVLSTATVVRSQQPADSFAAVDDAGQRALVEAARDSGVSHFIFVSVSRNVATPSPLMDAKRAVEDCITRAGIGYTILRPSAFIETWFGPMAGFDHAQHTGTVLGTGEQRLSYISQSDVARFAAAAAQMAEPVNGCVELGGPEPISQNEAVAVFERLTGAAYQVQHIPVAALRAQYEAAQHPTEKSFAGLMLALASDDVIPMEKTALQFGISPRPFAEVARSMVAAASIPAS